MRDYLREIFPNKSLAAIDDTLLAIENQIPDESFEIKLDSATEFLIATDDNEGGDEIHLLNEARGESRKLTEQELSSYFDQLINIFPDACPSYIRDLCFNSSGCVNFDLLFEKMTLADYPKKQIHPRDIFDQLRDMLPNADPTYLQAEADKLANRTENDLKTFLDTALETGDYPTMESYLKSQKNNEVIDRYTDGFTLDAFLKEFQDPEKYFMDPNRTYALPPSDADENDDELYVQTFLYNHYLYLRKKDIDRVFKMSSKNLIKTCTRLDTFRKALSLPRKIITPPPPSKNIELLKLIAFLKHRKAIRKHVKQYDLKYRLLKEEAINNGLLQTCACCYDEELIPEECYFCKNSCIFCKDCIKKGVETAIGDGKLDFPCLADCGSEYSIPTLQMVLESVVFSRMAQRKQMDEVKRANIDGLETCPFCEFATIPPPDSKIFTCLNSECMKESCRECRHVSHIPLRCSEIEYDEDVKMRTYIENKMTEALLRTCRKCNKVFIKASGCNKMTCSCGATMCYVCSSPIDDYRHFGDDGIRCPLYTTDLNKFHTTAVLEGAKKAKIELGIDKDPSKLKNDPSQDLI